MCRSVLILAMRSKTSRCVIASRALVGSSAIRSAGACSSDMTINILCAWPTLTSPGKRRRNDSSPGRPADASSAVTRSVWLFQFSRECARQASRICVPIRKAGFSAATGLCGIRLISRPRTSRIWRSL